MTAKEQLQEIRNLQISIEIKEERVKRLRARAESTTQSLTDMPTGSVEQDKLGKVVCEIAMLTLDIADELFILLQKQQKAMQQISKLADAKQRDVLTLYYVVGKNWEQVAEKMNYSRMQVYRCHVEALANI